LTIAAGGEPPIVWESNPKRAERETDYEVIDPARDNSSDHEAIYEASGDVGVLDKIIPKLKKNGEIVFAGFYSSPISFSFPPAFIKEARFRISAEFNTEDINITKSLLETGALSLEGLVSHEKSAIFSKAAYRQSFEDNAPVSNNDFVIFMSSVLNSAEILKRASFIKAGGKEKEIGDE
jgi:3-hydroxyethyl bacteriochlorophyllide a dehydrogenase